MAADVVRVTDRTSGGSTPVVINRHHLIKMTKTASSPAQFTVLFAEGVSIVVDQNDANNIVGGNLTSP